MTTHETKVVHTTDRFMKVIFTVIALCLVWLSVKDTRLEPSVVRAQGVYEHTLIGGSGLIGRNIKIDLDCTGC